MSNSPGDETKRNKNMKEKFERLKREKSGPGIYGRYGVR